MIFAQRHPPRFCVESTLQRRAHGAKQFSCFSSKGGTFLVARTPRPCSPWLHHLSNCIILFCSYVFFVYFFRRPIRSPSEEPPPASAPLSCPLCCTLHPTPSPSHRNPIASRMRPVVVLQVGQWTIVGNGIPSLPKRTKASGGQGSPPKKTHTATEHASPPVSGQMREGGSEKDRGAGRRDGRGRW